MAAKDFAGKEVSCRVIIPLIQKLQEKGHSEIFENISEYPLEHLLNKNERIDWDTAANLHKKAGEILSNEEFVEIGNSISKSPVYSPYILIPKLLFSPIECFKWIMKPEGVGNQDFTCIQTSYREIGPNHIEVTAIMEEGYEFCQEIYYVAKGNFIALPEMLGYDKAVVDVEFIEGGAHYDIKVPPGKPPLAFVRKALMWPFTMRQAGKELKEAYELLHERYQELEKKEKSLRESEEHFRIITESSMAGVYIIQDGKFKYANPAISQIFGYTPDELVDRLGPVELTHPDDRGLVVEQIRRRLSGEIEETRYTFRGLRKDGSVVHCEILGRLHNYKGEPAIIGTLVDITERIEVEEKMRRQLMRYSLEEGKLYLVKEPAPALSIEAFKDLLKVGYNGFVFSRMPEEEFRRAVDGDYVFFWLAETEGGKALQPDLVGLETVLKGHSRGSAFFIERLDYLVSKNGFDETLGFFQRLRELAYLEGYVVIVSVDPKTLDSRELGLLEKEANAVETLYREGLDENLLEILGFVYRQNSLGVKPSYADIGRDLEVSKPTVIKRMRRLSSTGYVLESLKGNRKSVEISEKGRSILLK